MNILIITGHYPPFTFGGGEISTHLIARGLSRSGVSCTVICEGNKEEETTHDGVHLIRTRAGLTHKPLNEHLFFKKIARFIASNVDLAKFTIIHAHDYKSTLIVRELIEMNYISGNKCVATIRDYAQISGDTTMILKDGSIPSQPFSPLSYWNSQRVYEAMLPRKFIRFAQYAINTRYRCSAFRTIPNHVYISNAQLQLVQKHQDLKGITVKVIYNPVPGEYLSANTMNGNKDNVLFVGRVEMYKGVFVLLKAWNNIIKVIPHAHLTIIGEGAQLKDCKQYVKNSSLQHTVTFKGKIPWDRMMQEYDSSSVVVSPHLWIEPFGRSVVEAMARGKVVVASDCGGPKEIIQNTVTGFLCNRGSEMGLHEILQKALHVSHHDTNEMGEHARKWISGNLSTSSIAQQYISFYKEIA